MRWTNLGSVTEAFLESAFDKNNSRDQHGNGHKCQDVDHFLETIGAGVKFEDSSHNFSFFNV